MELPQQLHRDVKVLAVLAQTDLRQAIIEGLEMWIEKNKKNYSLSF